MSLNTLFILVFAFCPYHIGHFTIAGLKLKSYVEGIHFEVRNVFSECSHNILMLLSEINLIGHILIDIFAFDIEAFSERIL